MMVSPFNDAICSGPFTTKSGIKKLGGINLDSLLTFSMGLTQVNLLDWGWFSILLSAHPQYPTNTESDLKHKRNFAFPGGDDSRV